MENEIVNKVSESGLLQVDLEELYQSGDRILFDLKNFLFEELILKEKDFREKLKQLDWNIYQNKFVAITCTADAIIPTWAFMLAAVQLQPIAKKVVFGNLQKLEEELFREKIYQLPVNNYLNKRIVIKGCSGHVPASAYIDMTNFLTPIVKSIMFGEPCSTVPVFKKK